MKKDLAVIFGLVIVVVGLLVFGGGFSTGVFLKQNESTGGALSESKENTNITIKDLTIIAKIADTTDKRKEGLAEKDSIPLQEGMLFVFAESDKYGIWMKNMKFAIDIIWIDENKNIIDIARDIPPELDKKDEDLTIYKPKGEAKYILEINAGISNLHNLQIEDQVEFNL